MFKFLSLPIICILYCVSCETTNTYVYNRALDFSDSFTLGVEKNNYGAGVWIYCFGGGLQFNEFAKGFGIRNGHYGLYKAGGEGEISLSNRGSGTVSNSMGNSYIYMNSNQHRPLYPDYKRSRNKKIDASNFMALVFFTDGKTSSGNKHCDSPVYIEASLGLYLGVRAGFSFSEFLDFLMGFSTYDLMDDDSDD
jgi:hypothetical protein